MREIGTKSVFLEAIERADPSAYIDEICASDSARRVRAQALLDAHESGNSLLREGKPASMLLEIAGHKHDESDSGLRNPVRPDTVIREDLDQIGPYKVERTLGEGGFGAVYLARQETPIERLVAIKVLKPGMDCKQVVRRFEVERKALALMEHPSIARIIEAGQTAQRRPYVIMEHVDGPAITEYCDENRLGLRERLALFEQVCMAVQHAHHRGIVHRDIKPSNVLVTEIDGKPLVKVIDFGVAKAMENSALDVTLTQGLHAIGTPAYMAPEQIMRGPNGVDTRTDVYGLGVLLYQLLTGKTPLNETNLADAGPAAIAQAICEVTPANPSTRIANLGDGADTTAYARRMDSHRLWCHLKGDLDWITMRAIEKDPARRYSTPSALAEDLRRYAKHEPVEASPPGRWYRFSLFLRRRPFEVAAAVTAVAAISALAIGGVWFGLRERDAAEHARAQLKRADVLAGFAQDLFTGVDPAVARELDTALLMQILDSGAQRVGDELTDYPSAAVSMLNAIGYAQVQIANYAEAETTYRQALSIAFDKLDPLDPDAISAIDSFAAALAEQGKLPESLALLEPHVERIRAAFGDEDERTMSAMSNLATVYHRMGRLEDAVTLLDPLLASRELLLGPTHQDTMLTMNNLAMVHEELGDLSKAEQMLRQVLAVQRKELTDEHPHTLATWNNLAGIIRDRGDAEQARSMFEQLIQTKQRVLPEGHPSILISQHNLSRTLLILGEAKEAESISRELVDRALEKFGPDHRLTLGARSGLAKALRTQERFEEAIEQYDVAWRGMVARSTDDANEVLSLRIALAETLLMAGRPEKAMTHATESLRLAQERWGEQSEPAQDARRVLAEIEEAS